MHLPWNIDMSLYINIDAYMFMDITSTCIHRNKNEQTCTYRYRYSQVRRVVEVSEKREEAERKRWNSFYTICKWKEQLISFFYRFSFIAITII